ncbi:MAG: hypothetical protein Q7K45_04850 [Nanoarchaeota archaeon]|nr:hypothetical protein [Nanoarchaeota archaeon]
MATLPQSKLEKVKHLYYTKKYSMKAIGQVYAVSLDCVAYFMRKNDLKRRTLAEEQKLRFENKIPSFTLKRRNKDTEELNAIGAMLYWGEGYKGDKENPANMVDFTNSDPEMISLFLRFLRNTFDLNKSKFRILLYCYSDQDVGKLITFWSDLTGIERSLFIKPYIRKDFRIGGRKMKYGLIHIRYHDKKLLLELKKMIDSYKSKYTRQSNSGNFTTL